MIAGHASEIWNLRLGKLPDYSWSVRKVIEAVYEKDYAIAWSLWYMRVDEETWAAPLLKLTGTGSVRCQSVSRP